MFLYIKQALMRTSGISAIPAQFSEFRSEIETSCLIRTRKQTERLVKVFSREVIVAFAFFRIVVSAIPLKQTKATLKLRLALQLCVGACKTPCNPGAYR